MSFRAMRLPDEVRCAKGLIPYCLEEASKGEGARARLRGLRDAVAALAPGYKGLENVFDERIVARLFQDKALRDGARNYLRTHWFDSSSPEAHFPGHDVARIYAAGVLKALDLCLKGRRVVPLSAWWLVDAPDVRAVTLADVSPEGVTIGGRVTLLIMTPRPAVEAPPNEKPILGEVAEASETRTTPAGVATIRVRDAAARAR